MAKGNKKAHEETNINKGFDALIKLFDDVKDTVKRDMPLLSKSLELDIEIIKIYKEAFNHAQKTK